MCIFGSKIAVCAHTQEGSRWPLRVILWGPSHPGAFITLPDLDMVPSEPHLRLLQKRNFNRKEMENMAVLVNLKPYVVISYFTSDRWFEHEDLFKTLFYRGMSCVSHVNLFFFFWVVHYHERNKYKWVKIMVIRSIKRLNYIRSECILYMFSLVLEGCFPSIYSAPWSSIHVLDQYWNTKPH